MDFLSFCQPCHHRPLTVCASSLCAATTECLPFGAPIIDYKLQSQLLLRTYCCDNIPNGRSLTRNVRVVVFLFTNRKVNKNEFIPFLSCSAALILLGQLSHVICTANSSWRTTNSYYNSDSLGHLSILITERESKLDVLLLLFYIVLQATVCKKQQQTWKHTTKTYK